MRFSYNNRFIIIKDQYLFIFSFSFSISFFIQESIVSSGFLDCSIDDREYLDQLISDAERLLHSLDQYREANSLLRAESKVSDNDNYNDNDNDNRDCKDEKLNFQINQLNEKMRKLKLHRNKLSRLCLSSSSPKLKRGKRCMLSCIQPDKSPFQGKYLTIDSSGASIGRKPSNTIVMAYQNGEVMQTIDSVIIYIYIYIYIL